MKSAILRTVLPLGLGVLAVWGAVIIPTALSIRSITDELGEERARLERSYRQQQDVRRTAENLQEIRAVAALVSDYAIRENDELRLIQALEDTAARRGITQEIRLQTTNQRQVTNWETVIPLALTLRGEYESIARYLHDLETLPYLVRIDTAQVQEIARTGTVEVRLAGHVHWIAGNAPAFLSPDPSL